MIRTYKALLLALVCMAGSHTNPVSCTETALEIEMHDFFEQLNGQNLDDSTYLATTLEKVQEVITLLAHDTMTRKKSSEEPQQVTRQRDPRIIQTILAHLAQIIGNIAQIIAARKNPAMIKHSITDLVTNLVTIVATATQPQREDEKTGV